MTADVQRAEALSGAQDPDRAQATTQAATKATHAASPVDAGADNGADSGPDNGPDNGIVSVNDRGSRGGGGIAPFLMIGAIALVVLIAGFLTLSVIRQKLTPSKAVATSDTKPVMTFDSGQDQAPALPGGAGAASAAACSDGSPGTLVRRANGTPVRSPDGHAVTLCANGQVAGLAEGATAAIPLVPPGDVAYPNPVYPSAPAYGGTGPAPRPAGAGALMLTGGGSRPVVASPLADAPADAILAALSGQGRSVPSDTGGLEAALTPSRLSGVEAGRVANLSLLLPRGRTIECGLTVRIVSSLAGLASCVVTRNVYSADGKVLLIDRGSEAVGEYRSDVRPGQRRLFIIWTRIITPQGVVIDLNSPAADALGGTGLQGQVDDHWFERIGTAFLLSSVENGLSYAAAKAQGAPAGQTIVLGSQAQTGSQMADRVLQQTIDIAPTLYKAQGDRAVIFVARDLDFTHVYRLHPTR